MEAIKSLKHKLENREVILSTALCNIGYSGLPRIYKKSGIDFLVMDLEHGSFNPENIGDFLYICNNMGLPVIVRALGSEYHCISKPLDMGADGILIPRTETIKQVETAISSMRFYPVGEKGVGGRGILRNGEEVNDFNKNRLLFLQIESTLGVNTLDEILTKYGNEVSGIIIGPYDMAVSLGCGLNIEADEVMENIKRTIKTCRKHKMSIGIFMDDESNVKSWKNLGINIFWIGTELSLLCSALSNVHNAVLGL